MVHGVALEITDDYHIPTLSTQVRNTIILLPIIIIIIVCFYMLYIFTAGSAYACMGKRERAFIFDCLVMCLHRVEHHNKRVKRLRATYLG